MKVPLLSASGLRRKSAGAALIVALSVAVAACSGGNSADPSPSATPSASAAPSASPSVAPPPPHEIVSGADVAVLERLNAPTTGETWHEPREIANLGLFYYPAFDIEDTYRYFEVGNLGAARLVVATTEYFEFYSGGYEVYALFVVTDTSAAMITCPSARGSDACLDWSADWEEPGRYLEPSVAFDTLTYPANVEPLAGWVLQPARLATTSHSTSLQAYGDANEFPSIATTPDERAFLGRDTRILLTALGDSNLVEFRAEGDVSGLTDSRYAVETPYGAVVPSESAFSAAYYGQGAVTWTDGTDTFTHPDASGSGGTMEYPVRSASLACFGPDETIADAFDPSEWEVAGSHRLGFDVYLPVAGGNDLAQDVWQTLRDASWGEDIEPSLAYPFDTFDQFLTARSVLAWERPDGEWVIAIDGYAGQRVYECA
ncbi:hypothetical protein [Demequina sp.]|uniref:hypothetical protein n=1 Tax=Demequina sp. TaxID=2050685 RepID=UPI0025BC20BB|nr:hypothetical protein [Demequina sp.]